MADGEAEWMKWLMASPDAEAESPDNPACLDTAVADGTAEAGDDEGVGALGEAQEAGEGEDDAAEGANPLAERTANKARADFFGALDELPDGGDEQEQAAAGGSAAGAADDARPRLAPTAKMHGAKGKGKGAGAAAAAAPAAEAQARSVPAMLPVAKAHTFAQGSGKGAGKPVVAKAPPQAGAAAGGAGAAAAPAATPGAGKGKGVGGKGSGTAPTPKAISSSVAAVVSETDGWSNYTCPRVGGGAAAKTSKHKDVHGGSSASTSKSKHSAAAAESWGESQLEPASATGLTKKGAAKVDMAAARAAYAKRKEMLQQKANGAPAGGGASGGGASQVEAAPKKHKGEKRQGGGGASHQKLEAEHPAKVAKTAAAALPEGTHIARPKKVKAAEIAPLAAVDNQGRQYDLTRVVVNFANVGASFSKNVLGKSKDRGDRLFDWEGVRRCVRYLKHDMNLKPIGVLFENFKGPDNQSRMARQIPDDIKQMCESIEETPRIIGKNHESADDEMTIKCAYRRNCRFMDNDNYRDWRQQLRDAKCRAWLDSVQDLLHMRYYFDRGLGTFDALEGNIPPSLLVPDKVVQMKEVTKRELWTLPNK